jgi:hypothetical protein
MTAVLESPLGDWLVAAQSISGEGKLVKATHLHMGLQKPDQCYSDLFGSGVGGVHSAYAPRVENEEQAEGDEGEEEEEAAE